jgi:cephalosporin-C deacetylase
MAQTSINTDEVAAPVTKPDDFDAYWQAIDDELAAVSAAPELEWLPLRSTDFSDTYFVSLTSIGPYRIHGYYSVPKGDGPFPGLYLLPGYASVVVPPPYEDRQRYAVLNLMYRGQRHSDKPYAAAFPGLLTDGIDDPRTYKFRSIFADLIRGAEFLRSRPEVDPARVGLMGNDWAITVAARRPGFAAVESAGSFFSSMLAMADRTDAYPIEELNDYRRTYPEKEDNVRRTLAYFDPIHQAPSLTTALLSVENDRNVLDGPEWLAPLRAACGGPVETYALTHEGQVDHDWIDAWMAAKLGAEAKPRLWPFPERAS